MADASVGSLSTNESTTYDAPRKRRDSLQRLKMRQISHQRDGSTDCDSETVGSQSTTSTMPQPSKPKEGPVNFSESSEGSQSTLSTKPSISPRQQQIVQMLRTRSASRRAPLASQPKLRSARSFSLSAKPPMYPVSMRTAKESSEKPPDHLRNGGSSQTTDKSINTSEAKSSVELNQHLSPAAISSPQPSTRRLQLKEDISTIQTIFHVRLSIGYMTGLKMEKVAKWTRNPNHSLVVGFVELASSGKYTALSQPLLPNAGEGKSAATKILWANPKAGKGASKSRRRLHFSLQLDRLCDLASDDDDDSLGSQALYSPEVVKLLVGLKCGDERLNLGVARFVVNGRETVEQKMDIAVQPSPSLASSTKTKRRIFGKKQRSSFTHGDHAYTLATNAKLRVKADIKTGLPGQDGAAVWASGHDDSSYLTNWTYDTGSVTPSAPLVTVQQGIQMMLSAPSQLGSPSSSSRAHVEGIDTGITYPLPTNPGSLHCQSKSTGPDLDDSTSIREANRVVQAPVQFVSLRSPTDVISYTSGITAPESGCDAWWFTKSCIPVLCGDGLERPKERHRFVTKSFSFESSQKIGTSDILAKTISVSTASSTDSSTAMGEDLQGTLIQIKKDMHADLPGQIGDPREMADDEVETLDVTVETYNDLIDARETLMRYAIKVGVDMGDLLDGKQVVRRQ
jgi:hypothetical protein